MLSAFIKLFIFSSFDSFPDRMLVVFIVEKRDVIDPVRTAPGGRKNAALYFSIIFSTSRMNQRRLHLRSQSMTEKYLSHFLA